MSGLPPLFKQGASARARALFFAAIAVVLLLIDSHLHSLSPMRQAVGTALYPLQMLALVPRNAADHVSDYFSSLNHLQQENRALKLRQALSSQLLQQERQMAAENAQLRNLLGMQQRILVPSVVGEILYDARDAFTRKVVLNRGSQQDVALGQPVIDDLGVVGQVTRIFPFIAEVTLLTDKDQAIPVQVLRNGLRSIAYGRGQSGALDLRFMAANADIRNGDLLVTSGIDGVYPAGLAVATVTQVEVKSADAFARIVCTPIAGIDRHKQLLVLLVPQNQTPRPPPEAVIGKNGMAAQMALEMRDKSIAVSDGSVGSTAASPSVTVANGKDVAAAPSATSSASLPVPAVPVAPLVPPPALKVAR